MVQNYLNPHVVKAVHFENFVIDPYSYSFSNFDWKLQYIACFDESHCDYHLMSFNLARFDDQINRSFAIVATAKSNFAFLSMYLYLFGQERSLSFPGTCSEALAGNYLQQLGSDNHSYSLPSSDWGVNVDSSNYSYEERMLTN